MRKLLLFLAILLMSIPFPCEGSILAKLTGNESCQDAVGVGSADDTIAIYDTLAFVPPDYLGFAESSPLRDLSKLLKFKSFKELNFVQNQSRSVSESKFQLIVDMGGNIIDCVLLESSDLSKDNTVLNYLPNSRLFISPGKLNGTPCYSVVIMSICYFKGGMSHRMTSYPILKTDALPEDE